MDNRTNQPNAAQGGRSRSTLLLAVAVALAGFVAFLVFGVIESFNEQLRVAQEPDLTKTVVVATQELPMGAVILAEQLEAVEAPPGMVPEEGTFEKIEDVAGRTPRERVLPGEFLRDARLASADSGVGLNVLITAGMRAMTIETDSQSGVGGFLQTGYRVDVIVTIRPDDNALKAKWVTEIILQDVRVLAVGGKLPGTDSTTDTERRVQAASRRHRNFVTLEVDVAEAQRLALASARGDLHLALRSDVNLELLANRGPLLTNEMVGLRKAPRRSARRRPAMETAEVIAGDRTVIETFDPTGRKVSESRTKR